MDFYTLLIGKLEETHSVALGFARQGEKDDEIMESNRMPVRQLLTLVSWRIQSVEANQGSCVSTEQKQKLFDCTYAAHANIIVGHDDRYAEPDDSLFLDNPPED